MVTQGNGVEDDANIGTAEDVLLLSHHACFIAPVPLRVKVMERVLGQVPALDQPIHQRVHVHQMLVLSSKMDAANLVLDGQSGGLPRRQPVELRQMTLIARPAGQHLGEVDGVLRAERANGSVAHHIEQQVERILAVARGRRGSLFAVAHIGQVQRAQLAQQLAAICGNRGYRCCLRPVLGHIFPLARPWAVPRGPRRLTGMSDLGHRRGWHRSNGLSGACIVHGPHALNKRYPQAMPFLAVGRKVDHPVGPSMQVVEGGAHRSWRWTDGRHGEAGMTGVM